MRVLGEVERLAGRGIGVVFSSHDPDQAFLLAQRVAVLSRGRLVGLGPPAEVITRESLAAIYGVAVDVVSIARPEGGATRVCVPSLVRPVAY